MTAPDPTPPADLPDDATATLRDLTDHELREAVAYGQELLQQRGDTTPRIEPQPGEEIVSMEDRDGYLAVTKRQPCAEGCSDCPHGPYLYHVTEEAHADGGTHYHWTFVGPVVEPSE
ncbi:hypothetical protein [Halostella salina]|uniref:hypothetical protein n=1 Tax=Halostella salina TaxID=1547897 RepID=UPI000EF79771|nr:hypothetical protein [Halostella salina]